MALSHAEYWSADNVTNVFAYPNRFTNRSQRIHTPQTHTRGFVGAIVTPLEHCPIWIFAAKNVVKHLRKRNLDPTCAVYIECYDYMRVRKEVFDYMITTCGYAPYMASDGHRSTEFVYQRYLPYELIGIGSLISSVIHSILH